MLQTSASLQMSRIADVRVVSLAAPPGASSSPKVKLITGLGAGGGMLIGCVLALTRKRRPPGFESQRELSLVTGLPVLAALRSPSKRRVRAELPGCCASITGLQSEALRVLRMRLRRIGRSSAPRSVVFTSATRGQGASSVAAAFARVAACDGERVLLIEGDLQNPELNDLMRTSAKGLVQVLEANAPWREMLSRDNLAPLDLLLTGQVPSRSPVLVRSICLQNLLAEAANVYTLIVLDAPPVATAYGALALVDCVDATILVVDRGKATSEATEDAARRLVETSNNPVTALLIER
jgi:Mrp family chromosome partitioning ATPase